MHLVDPCIDCRDILILWPHRLHLLLLVATSDTLLPILAAYHLISVANWGGICIVLPSLLASNQLICEAKTGRRMGQDFGGFASPCCHFWPPMSWWVPRISSQAAWGPGLKGCVFSMEKAQPLEGSNYAPGLASMSLRCPWP